jgi:hypothetical protein
LLKYKIFSGRLTWFAMRSNRLVDRSETVTRGLAVF